MELAQLSRELVTLLTPFLPTLLEAGTEVAKGGLNSMGTDGWKTLQSIWGRLRPQLESKSAAIEAAQDLAADPDSTDAQAALRIQIRKLLEVDVSLSRDLSELLEGTRQTVTATITQTAGDGSVQVGQTFGNVNIQR